MRCEEINQWLDLLMDDALDAAQRQELNEHAHSCPRCAEQLRATLKLKAMLETLPEEADVPLAAQAAWRNAVRAESKRGASRRVARMISGLAAAVVVALGIGWALRPSMLPKQSETAMLETAAKGVAYEAEAADMAEADYDLALASGAMLETDGVGGAAPLASGAEGESVAPMQSVTLHVSDVEAAARGIADTAAELEGETAMQAIEGVGAHIEATLPAENAADFLLAVSQWDADPEGVDLPEVRAEGSVSLLIVLEQ